MKKNLQGIIILITAFAKHPKHLALIRNTRSLEWPSGRTWVAMDLLQKKYLPRDGLTHFDADKVLLDVVMEVNEEPSDFKDRLLDVQYRYPADVSNRQVLNQFLRGCEPKYKTSILQIYHENPDFDIEILSDKLQIDYRLAGALESTFLDDNEPETLLTQVDPPPRQVSVPNRSSAFNSDKVCYLCGKRGHLMHYCPKASPKDSELFQV